MKIKWGGCSSAIGENIEKYGNGPWNIYMICMITLLILRYVVKLSVPSVLFLGVAMLPVLWGTETHRLAFVMSCIPFSVAFQYKYALLILCAVWVWESKGQLRSANVLLLVLLMMIWELLHAFHERFSYIEYLRGFAELLTIGMVMTRNLQRIDVKLIIRALAISVVAVDCIMLFMQLQQNGFSIIAVLSRTAKAYRFGQGNMDAGQFALNFNANNLGFINVLSLCGLLFGVKQYRMKWYDVVLAITSSIFAIMTLSRTAFLCIVLLIVMNTVKWKGRSIKQIARTFVFLLLVACVILGIMHYMPSVVENLLERFGRNDEYGDRSNLLERYMQHSFSSVTYFLFGIGVQEISQKMNELHGWLINVPHNGMQEVFVAWGIVGVVLVCMMLWLLVKQSKQEGSERRTLEYFSPLVLILFYTMAGQFLTAGRTLLALVFAYVVMKKETIALKHERCGENTMEENM